MSLFYRHGQPATLRSQDKLVRQSSALLISRGLILLCLTILNCGRNYVQPATYSGEDEKLSAAITARDIPGIRRAIKSGASVDIADYIGSTVLYQVVCERQDYEIAKILLEHKADPDANPWARVDERKRYNSKDPVLHPIYCAVRAGNIEMTKLLISAGSNSEFESWSGPESNPLKLAVSKGNTEIIRLLLAAGYEGKAFDPSGGTALHYAATADAVRLLLAAGYKVKARNDESKNDYTPLHFVAAGSHSAAVDALIQAGAEVDAISGPNEESPLTYLIRQSLETRDYFQDINREAQMLSTVSTLLKWKASVNLRSQRKMTALMYAVQDLRASDGFRTKLIALLLEGGADITLLDSEGRSVLYYAFLRSALLDSPGSIKVLKMLVDNGAKVQSGDERADGSFICAGSPAETILLKAGGYGGRDCAASAEAAKQKKKQCLKWASSATKPINHEPKSIEAACRKMWTSGSEDWWQCVKTWGDCSIYW